MPAAHLTRRFISRSFNEWQRDGLGYNHPWSRTIQRAHVKRISFKGVAIGNIVDIVATNIVMTPIMIYILASAGAASLPDHDSANLLQASTVYVAASSILGGVCSVLGGYVSARIAARDELLNGALASILCIGFGVYAVINGTGRLWLDVLDLPLSPALGALGGYLRSRQAGTAG